MSQGGEGGATGAVAQLLMRHGELTRFQIAKLSGLSAATVSTTVAGLLASGSVVELSPGIRSEGHGRRGRLGARLSFHPAAGSVIGVDFGHRHLRVVLVDLAHRILAEATEALDTDYEASAGLARVERLIPELLESSTVRPGHLLGVGLGLPGPVRHGGQVGSASILPAWVGREPAQEVRQRLGLEAWVDNDANLGALAEAAWGATRGMANSIYLKLGAGVGAGLVLSGRLFRGAGGTAGEVGHTRVVAAGDVCRCGSRGCLETVVGLPALVRPLRSRHGTGFGPTQLIEQALAGDAGCRRVVEDAGRHVGLAVAHLLNLFNPERVVIGGELAAAGELLLAPIRAEAARDAISSASEQADIVGATLGHRATVLGAAALVLHDSSRCFPPRPERPVPPPNRLASAPSSRVGMEVLS